MSAGERPFDTIRDMMLMRADMKRLADGTTRLTADVRDIDRRLIRIETMIEIAEKRANGGPEGGATPQLAR